MQQVPIPYINSYEHDNRRINNVIPFVSNIGGTTKEDWYYAYEEDLKYIYKKFIKIFYKINKSRRDWVHYYQDFVDFMWENSSGNIQEYL